MIIWLIEIGETLPLPGYKDRLLRYGVLADMLVSHGHQVVWWSSTFDHVKKKHLYESHKTINIGNNYKLILLHAKGYKRNISVNRMINHHLIAKMFSRQARNLDPPDVIFCGFPTIEFCFEAVNYGHSHKIPVIIDIQDLWPDIFINILPQSLRYFGKLLLLPYFIKTKILFRKCSAITAVSNGYLQWGLHKANRAIGLLDEVFPIGYQRPRIEPNKLSEAYQKIHDLGIDRNQTICWFAGTFGRTYDLLTVIKAAKVLNNENIQFVFTGSGEQEQCWRLASKELNNIIFTGWGDLPLMVALSEIADIGLMAYAKGAPQGLPNKVFEYLAAGLPILSSLQGETAQLLQENECGVTYEPENVNSLIAAFNHIILDKGLLNQMGLNAINVFNKLYDTNIVYNKLVHYIETFVSTSKR